MLVEIRRAGFINQGSALMIHAILQRMRRAYPGAKFTMAPSVDVRRGTTPYSSRAELGLLQKAWLWRYGRQWGDLAACLPQNIREMYGIVLDRDINVVFDAAGYLYGDPWGKQAVVEMARASVRWHKQGTKVILLPQALGPYSHTEIAGAMRAVIENADLIFPRERISFNHIVALAGERPNIRMAPDFTNLVQGILPGDFNPEDKRICIVPNYRMLDKTAREDSIAYLPFMIDCTKYLLQQGARPFILLHETAEDIALAGSIAAAVGGNIPVVREDDPLKVKGILGQCDATLGSRFHGLASALSQGVPALATGWSHKYQMLFEDYGFSEGMLDVRADAGEIRRKLDLIIDPQSRSAISQAIAQRSGLLKQAAEDMWRQVFDVIGSR
jgi:polysaccharide pyruvyl transferase WcaK-like protein